MGMINTRRMEDVSFAYLSAIAAQASVDYERLFHDDDSADCLLKKNFVLYGEPSKSCLFNQMKSTASKSQYTMGENEITYRLSKKNYDDLRVYPGNIILCLLILPKESIKPWVELTDDDLLLHGRMYWCSLRNKPDIKQQDKITVKFPKSQILYPDVLNTLMLQALQGGIQ